MMTEPLDHYQDLNRQWLSLRDDPQVTETKKDSHLELMDEAWDALTEDEQQIVNEESTCIAESLRSSIPEMVDVPTEDGAFPRKIVKEPS